MKEADIVVVPSRWEGFGLIAAEALRNSKPIIASRVGGLTELVIPGKNGWLFKAGDSNALKAILLAVEKDGLAAMGAESRQHFEKTLRPSA